MRVARECAAWVQRLFCRVCGLRFAVFRLTIEGFGFRAHGGVGFGFVCERWHAMRASRCTPFHTHSTPVLAHPRHTQLRIDFIGALRVWFDLRHTRRRRKGRPRDRQRGGIFCRRRGGCEHGVWGVERLDSRRYHAKPVRDPTHSTIRPQPKCLGPRHRLVAEMGET